MKKQVLIKQVFTALKGMDGVQYKKQCEDNDDVSAKIIGFLDIVF